MTRAATNFYAWLIEQRHRDDEVGRLANEAFRDKTFPREVRKIGIFLHYYTHEPLNYSTVKLAHAEWRKLRKQELTHDTRTSTPAQTEKTETKDESEAGKSAVR